MSPRIRSFNIDIFIIISEELDEEAAEWEHEQLRRGGHRTPEPEADIKPVYKAAPSMTFFVTQDKF